MSLQTDIKHTTAGVPLADLEGIVKGLYQQVKAKVANGQGTKEDIRALNTARIELLGTDVKLGE